MNDEKYITLCRKFYTDYGYYKAMSEFNYYSAFINFLESTMYVFEQMGHENYFKYESIVSNVWEDDDLLKDDLNCDEIVEEIEEIFRYANF